MTTTLGEKIAAISAWVDGSPENRARDPEARTWGRLAKVAEEGGEVVSAYIGVTGQNPRKGNTHTQEDVEKELLDVALTALAAHEHLTGNRGESVSALVRHTDVVLARAGIEVPAK